MSLRRWGVALIVAGALLAGTGGSANAAGNSVIANAASLAYEVAPGRTFTVTSNTVQVVVAAVAAIDVSPDEPAPNPRTETFGAGLPVTRTFRISNAGNVADAYVVTAVTTGAGRVASIAFDAPNGATLAAAIGTTVSPQVGPGGSLGVIVEVTTAGVASGTVFAIGITIRSAGVGTANGPRSASGRSWAVAVAPPAFSGPSGARSAVLKTVNGAAAQQAQPGGSLVYQIRFRNAGAVAATGVVVTDEMPPDVVADSENVQLDGAAVSATLTGRTLRVPIAAVAAGATHVVIIPATLDTNAVAGTTYVNTAVLSADGIAAATSTPAAVLAGRSDVVYDALLGAGHPIGSATVSLVDPVTLRPIALGNASPASPVNPANANPFVTAADGVYAFAIPVPAAGTTGAFDIIVRATGYVDRKISAKIVSDPTGTLFTVLLAALDDQPLAQPGSFALTAAGVRLTDVVGLLGNVPMLPAKRLAVTKTADRTVAQAGDRVSYTIAFSSNATTELGTTSIVDTPAPGLAYARGTATLDGVRCEPRVQGGTLTWTLPSLAPAQTHTLTYRAVILPGVPDGATIANRVIVRATVPGTPIVASTGAAQVGVVVNAGIFGDRGTLTGRVFVAARGTDHFGAGARGVGAVRLYLENGTAVTTDADGRFSFRAVRPGMHVVRLDETSLPGGLRLAGRAIDDVRSAIRLVHGVFDEGTMHDVHFVLEAIP